MVRDRALTNLLLVRRHVLSSADLKTLGYDRRGIARLVTRQRLVREYRGVYRDGGVPLTVDISARCALMATGALACLGLESSAHRLGFLDYPPKRPQVVVPARKRRHDKPGFDLHRFPTLVEADIIVVDGERCTSPGRTVLDLAAGADTPAKKKALRRVLRQAVKADPSLTGRLRAELDDRSPFKGSLRLRSLMDDNLLGSLVVRSSLEEEFLEFCKARGLPAPEMNAIIEGKEVDAAWFLQRVAVELDTFDHHGSELSFEEDRERDEFLRERGWPVSRITGRRLRRDGDRVEAQLRGRLGLPPR